MTSSAGATSLLLFREEYGINCVEQTPNPSPTLCPPTDWAIAADSPTNGSCSLSALQDMVTITAPSGCTIHSIEAVISFSGGAQCVAGGTTSVTGIGTASATIQAKTGGTIVTTYVVYAC